MGLKLEHEIGSYDEVAYIIPNEHIAPETPLEAFQVTLEKVERLSGIILR